MAITIASWLSFPPQAKTLCPSGSFSSPASFSLQLIDVVVVVVVPSYFASSLASFSLQLLVFWESLDEEVSFSANDEAVFSSSTCVVVAECLS